MSVFQSKETEARTKIAQERDEAAARSEMQLTALNENLGTLRADYTATQNKTQEVQKLMDELQGQKLGQEVG